MRIVTGCISHETSTFTPVVTTRESFFARFGDVRGPAIIEKFRDTNTPTGGFIEGAEVHGFAVIPTIFAEAHPSGPVLASHQNCRTLVPGERQFSDEQLQAIIERGGVIGVSMDTWMLYRAGDLDWAKAGITERRDLFPRSAVTLEQVADHIDHICQLAGNADHAAIGGDTDGQGGIEGAPADVESVADYQKLAAILMGRGYDQGAIAQIFFGNWARVYRRWLPA